MRACVDVGDGEGFIVGIGDSRVITMTANHSTGQSQMTANHGTRQPRTTRNDRAGLERLWLGPTRNKSAGLKRLVLGLHIRLGGGLRRSKFVVGVRI